MSKLTTIEFAERVNLTYGRIMQLIQAGEINPERFGRAYMIDSKYVEIVKNRPEKRGRPLNSKNKPKINSSENNKGVAA